MDEAGRPTIYTVIAGVGKNMLVDTGAAVTMTNRVKNGDSSVSIMGVTGNPQEVRAGPIDVAVGGKTIQVEAIVGWPEEILGIEALKKGNFIVDLANFCLWKTEKVNQVSTELTKGAVLPMAYIVSPIKSLEKNKLKLDGQPEWLQKLIQDIPVWATDKLDCGRMKGMVLLEGGDPQWQKQYPVPRESVTSITEMIEMLEKRGIIKSGNGYACNSPCWPVRKAVLKGNGDEKAASSWRLTIDYRAVNKLAKRMAPVVSVYCEMMSKISPEMKVFTIFHTYMKNALTAFPRPDRIIQYVDDVLLQSPNMEEHKEDLAILLQCILEAGLKLNGAKAQLACHKVNFLGVTISGDGRSIDQDRAKVIAQLPIPTDRTALQSLLGIMGFCREFTPRYAQLAQPLYELLRAQNWDWTEEHTSAVQKLKAELGSAPTLASPDHEKEFRLYPITMPDSQGAVITQLWGHAERPVAFGSQMLSAVELKFGWCERLILAAYWAIRRFKYLFGTQTIIICTHHTPLQILRQGSLAISHINNARIQKWTMALLADNISTHALREPKEWVAGICIKGEAHECQIYPESTCHAVFKDATHLVITSDPVWYTDGSCHYAQGKRISGMAGVKMLGKDIIKEFGFRIKAYSAQYAELAAVIEVLQQESGRSDILTIVLDSDWVFRGTCLLLKWWDSNQFLATDGSPVKFQDLWQMVEKLSQNFKRVNMIKVRAHKKTGPHREGNYLADRYAKEAAVQAEDWKPPTKNTLQIASTTRSKSSFISIRMKQLQELQDQDEELKDIREKLQKGEEVIYGGKKVMEEQGLICISETGEPIWIVPQQVRKDLLRWIHGSQAGGHPKIREAKERIRHLGWWIGQNKDLEEFVDSCIICARFDQSNKKRRGELMRQTPVGPWERIQIDYTGPLPTTTRGNKYILMIVDSFSRWMIAIPTRNCTALTTARKLVSDVLTVWGIPKVLDCDNGAAFIGNVMKELCKMVGIELKHHIPYHPQAAGQVERMNGTIKRELKKQVAEHGQAWDIYIPL
ncbi:NYNRIN-like [Pelobates cultripes]|uniref:Gypsy retrotransposon integrase-like protein 1 n=1 Tax=Pelobates cultripes TaxID=61616 RepID=A0AAD1R1H7_PELCU|nr:NYNRIN-like [Pelobates cultripes]